MGNSGQPCGLSFISSSYTCRLGLNSTYSNLDKWRGDAGVKKELEKFEERIAPLNPEAQSVWRRSMNEFLSLGTKSSKIRIATEEVLNTPKKVVIGGEVFDAPINMIPRIGKAQFKWENPVTGTVFNKAGKDGVSETNGVSLGKSIVEKARLPYIGAAAKYKAELESKGESWPAARTRQVSDTEVDAEWQKVKDKLWMRGGNTQDTNRGRNELEVVYKIQERNPSPEVIALREAKEKAIVRTWLEHDKRSPVTGLPVKLPTNGGREVTVDHIKAYDALRREFPKLSPLELSKIADTAANYYVVEAAPNNWKGSLPSWAAWLKRDENKNMSHLAEHLQKKQNTQPNVVMLSKEQFKSRFPSLSYDNKSDRQRAAVEEGNKLVSALLTTAGIKYSPATKQEPSRKRTAGVGGKGSREKAKNHEAKRAVIQRAAQVQFDSLKAQGKSPREALNSMKRLFPPAVLVYLK
jgi:hypothetical protein